jgi:hypothetical protein
MIVTRGEKMTIDNSDLIEYVYNPSLTQQRVLDYLELATNGSIVIGEPTNPFIFLLETAAQISANAITASDNILKKKFPELCYNREELYPFFGSDDIKTLFNTPSTGVFTIYVSLTDLRNNGYRFGDSSMVEMVVPELTSVSLAGNIFTIMNPISVRFFNTGIAEVEMLSTTNPNGFSNIGLLPNEVVTDSDSNVWIGFNIPILQYSTTTYNKTIITSNGFDLTHNITTGFGGIVVKYKNNQTNGMYTSMNVKLTDDFLDVTTPTAIVTVLSDKVIVRIPAIYTNNGLVSGGISIVVFETSGSLFLPINKYSITDFVVTLGNTSVSPQTAVANNITLLMGGVDVVTGGSTGISDSAMKSIVVSNTVGSPQYPLTIDGLSNISALNGFELEKKTDNIMGRTFSVYGELPNTVGGGITSRIDFFINKTMITFDATSLYMSAVDNEIIIKPGYIYEEINGVVKPVDDVDISTILNATNATAINLVGGRNLFVSPLLYLCGNEYITSSCRVYNVSHPTVTSSRIVDKNRKVGININSSSYVVTQEKDKFRIYISVIGNSDYDKLVDKTVIKAQLKFTTYGGKGDVYYTGQYDVAVGMIVVDVYTTFHMDANDNIQLIMGVSNISTRYIQLAGICTLIIYTQTMTITDSAGYRIKDLPNSDDSVFITEESFNINLGSRLSNIDSDVYSYYNDKRYKTYEVDMPLRQTENVYDVNPDNNTIFFNKVGAVSPGECTMETRCSSNRGDILLDSSGNPMYEFRSGDVMLDDSSKPIVDLAGGVVRIINILMIDIRYYLASSPAYINYFNTVVPTIQSWDSGILTNLVNSVLENSRIQLSSYYTSKPILISTGESVYSIPYYITPTVMIYRDYTVFTQATIDDIKSTVTEYISDKLSSSYLIDVVNMNKELQSKLPTGVIAVRIDNLDPVNNAQYFRLLTDKNRLSMKRTLYIDPMGAMSVGYDIEIKIISLN